MVSKLLLIGGAIAATAVVGAVVWTRQVPPEQKVAKVELSVDRTTAQIRQLVTLSVNAVNALGAPAAQQSISAGQFGNFPLTDDYGRAELGVVFEKPGQYMALASAGGIQSDAVSIVVQGEPSGVTIIGATTTITEQGKTVLVTPSTTTVEVEGALVPTQTLLQAAQLTGVPVISSTSVALLGTPVIPTPTFSYIDELNAYYDTAKGRASPFYDRGVIGYNPDGSFIFQYAELGGVSRYGASFFNYGEYLSAFVAPVSALNPTPTTISASQLQKSGFGFLIQGGIGSTVPVGSRHAESLGIPSATYTLVA